MTEQLQNFIAPLKMHLWSSKSTLDSLRSVFNQGKPVQPVSTYLGGNRRWVPLRKVRLGIEMLKG